MRARDDDSGWKRGARGIDGNRNLAKFDRPIDRASIRKVEAALVAGQDGKEWGIQAGFDEGLTRGGPSRHKPRSAPINYSASMRSRPLAKGK